MADLQMLTTPRVGPDLYDRDYNGVNTHLAVIFDDIIGEPESFHTYKWVWVNAYKCYDVCNAFNYHLLTICCGFCSALVVASEIASAFFFHIWCGAPCLKKWDLNCYLPQRCCQTFVDCFMKPCYGLSSKHLGSGTPSSGEAAKQCNGAVPTPKDCNV